MANKSISMSKLRHLLQLYVQGRSKKLISEQTGIARNTLKKYIKEFSEAGLSLEALLALSDKELEDLFVKSDIKPLNKKLATLFGHRLELVGDSLRKRNKKEVEEPTMINDN